MNMLTLKIDPIQSKLAKMGISFNAYQKLLAIAEDVIQKQGFTPVKITPIIKPEYDLAQIVIEFDRMTPQQSSQLNSIINETVLHAGLDDEQFEQEVRNITTECTLAYEVA